MFDPAVAAKAQGWKYVANNFSFGAFDDMVLHVEKTLSGRPYIAGDKFTAADTQLGSGIHYTTNVLHALPERPVFKAYLDRVTARPAYQRSAAKDYEMAKEAGMAGAA